MNLNKDDLNYILLCPEENPKCDYTRATPIEQDKSTGITKIYFAQTGNSFIYSDNPESISRGEGFYFNKVQIKANKEYTAQFYHTNQKEKRIQIHNYGNRKNLLWNEIYVNAINDYSKLTMN